MATVVEPSQLLLSNRHGCCSVAITATVVETITAAVVETITATVVEPLQLL